MTTLDQALEHHKAGRLEEAEAAYRELLAREPDNPDALHMLGVIAHQSGEQEKAVGLFEQAIGANPKVPEYHNNLGEAYRGLQAFDAAVTAFERAIALNPDLAVTHYNLGNALQAQGKLRQAIAAFERALVLVTDDQVAHGRVTHALQIARYLREIERLFKKGNLAQASIYSLVVLQLKPDEPIALYYLGLIAESLKLWEHALRYLNDAFSFSANWDLPRNAMERVNRQSGDSRLPEDTAKGDSQTRVKERRYLLVKAWGCGFWADVFHVLGQLLVAEITDRIPIVYWGANSLFGDGTETNAFDFYFESISPIAIKDLENGKLSFFPKKWNQKNLRQEDLNKWKGPGSRMGGLYFLNRSEKVLVSDFYSEVLELQPWISSNHHLYGLSVDELYLYLIEKYLHPKAYILDRVETFYKGHLADSRFLSVHVRGSDKMSEQISLGEINEAYFDVIDKFLSTRPGFRIFLMTDDERLLSAFSYRYGNILAATACQRTDNGTGLHYRDSVDGRKLGVEMMVDTYVAVRGEAFIGNAYSNPSTMVRYLKTWHKDNIHLFSRNVHHQLNTYLHDW